jgi:hypothetical protein
MGLFDTVRCRYRVPDPRLQDAEFQTKDLDRLLLTYTITEEGRLLRHAAPRYGGAYVDRDVEWPIHGDILIYTADPDRERELVDLVVRFTHGRVESIQRPRAGEGPRGAPAVEPRRGDSRQTDSSGPSSFLATVEERRRAERRVPAGADDDERATERRLVESMRRDRVELDDLLQSCSDHWGFEDPVYRFYHQSFKVYALQQTTERIVARLGALLPDRELAPWFREIVDSGTHLQFEPDHNARWLEVTRPIVEAFFHARYFLEMAVRYGELEDPPSPLPSGYAALLCLYGLR